MLSILAGIAQGISKVFLYVASTTDETRTHKTPCEHRTYGSNW